MKILFFSLILLLFIVTPIFAIFVPIGDDQILPSLQRTTESGKGNSVLTSHIIPSIQGNGDNVNNIPRVQSPIVAYQQKKYDENKSFTLSNFSSISAFSTPIIADHTTARLSILREIPTYYIQRARERLHIFYAHTSHGSQITDGMTGLASFAGAPQPSSQFGWNNGGTDSKLDLRDYYGDYGDLGRYGDLSWADHTRTYLASHPDVNVVMWSWCGGVSDNTVEGINTYLNAMNSLETEFPNIVFIYMTGHLDGTGTAGNLNIRNNQIRNYCRTNNKVLFDFADIESYNPDNIYFLNRGADDACNYCSPSFGNWAIEWQITHVKGTAWYECESAHTEPLNANLKAYAIWWLWARLAGWSGEQINHDHNGVFRPSTGRWYLDLNGDYLSNSGDKNYGFGVNGDIPVTGDWNGDGTTDIGVYRPSELKWYLDYTGDRLSNRGDKYSRIGNPDDIPVTGNWDGDGTTNIGVFRPSTGRWYLDLNGDYLSNSGDKNYGFGVNGDIPVTGDWNGDGTTDIGVFRPSELRWYLDYNGDRLSNRGDKYSRIGNPDDIPVTGDWNGDGKTDIGVFRPSTGRWYLDLNGDYLSNSGDKNYGFGVNGDIPIIGDWV